MTRIDRKPGRSNKRASEPFDVQILSLAAARGHVTSFSYMRTRKSSQAKYKHGKQVCQSKMTSASQSSNGITLKTLLENPELQHPPLMTEGKHVKQKEAGSELPEIDFSSAFLGPHLWEKTYDANDFNLEYMDLDEFLGENSIPLEDEAMLSQRGGSSTQDQHSCSQSSAQCCPKETFSSKVQEVQQTQTPTHPFSSLILPSASFSFITKEVKIYEKGAPVSDAGVALHSQSPGASSAGSSPPVSPLPIKVNVQFTEQDLALASVPGQDFNPCCTNFTDEELKPQPMIKKSKKIFVPEEMKDDKYWARRRKNNSAAKRSRDARRVKENQIALRASYLEKENKCLREEMEKIRLENAKLKHRLSKYEPEILKNL